MIIGDLIAVVKEPVRFGERAVDQRTIMDILDAARLAPSANNSQIWRFLVIDGEHLLREVAALSGKPAFAGSRTVIVACAEPWIVGRRGREQPFFMIDVPIALSHVVLAARERGVSVSLSFEFDEQRVMKLIDAPKGYRGVALVAIGYPEEDLSPTWAVPNDFVRVL